MELICAVQEYAWGVPGKASSVAQLAQAMQPSFIIEELKTYAELWMGTHPNGPSVIKGSGEPLSSFIANHPACLGSIITKKFDNQLPFLFKVLSVNQALSIQAHPNKSHAEELHATRPDVYKDPNHKPEMTIALTPFLALCGFRPHQEIINFFKELPELVSVTGAAAAQTFTSAPSSATLCPCFAGLMTASTEVVGAALATLGARLQGMDSATAAPLLAPTFLSLLQQYPGDGGCLAIYLLNLVHLEPGQAMFLGPNVIHAYLKGDCVECMACSDNVVRAGLTPKYQDVPTLLSMLQYDMTPVSQRLFEPQQMDGNTKLFNPPVPDFAVEDITVSSGSSYSLRTTDSCSLLLVVEGSAACTAPHPLPPHSPPPPVSVARGSVVFLPANFTLKLEAEQTVRAFRALCCD